MRTKHHGIHDFWAWPGFRSTCRPRRPTTSASPSATVGCLPRRKQIGKFKRQVLTLVRLRIYFKGGRATVEIVLANDKDRFDERNSIKERETKRDTDRALRDANR